MASVVKKKPWVKRIPEDMVGRRFKNLTVMCFSRRLKNRRMWKCSCVCGGEKEVATSDLNSGHVKSCGCLGRVNALAYGESSFNKLFGAYRHQAKTRGLGFSLSKKHFRELVTNSCHYCGIPPSNSVKKKGSNGEFVYSGIDRVATKYGYSVKNCVPCCKTCNWAKGTMNLEEFKSWITRIAAHNS
ncbi:hypothetical protein LCGC14_0244760 [marine sediment metagenome]|uniref:HNH domain-containing protein n=1 Tax=marine sediment metagenome TaxID=412755 RepID=A0A0F9UB66_9ZZZZ